MGKQKNRRYKSHLPAAQSQALSSKRAAEVDETSRNSSSTSLPIDCKENVFEGLNIANFLKDSSGADDTMSIKSYISNKSIKGEKVITKKEKLKLRREMFLKKIDTVNQFKKGYKLQKKNTMTAIIGDKRHLLDNLPSLEPLLKMTDRTKSNQMRKPKKKAIEKSKKMQKDLIQNISVYKKLLKNPSFEENPFNAISDHLKATVEQERKCTKNSGSK